MKNCNAIDWKLQIDSMIDRDNLIAWKKYQRLYHVSNIINLEKCINFDICNMILVMKNWSFKEFLKNITVI